DWSSDVCSSDLITHEFEQRTVKIVRAGFRDYGHDTARKAAVLGVVVVRFHPEFLDRIRVRKDVPGIAQSGHVRAAVQVITYRSGAAVHSAVNQGPLLRVAQNDAILRGLDARH